MKKIIKKVAILLPSLKFGGAERVSLNLAKEMKLQGISVEILLMSKEGEFLKEAESNFTVVDLRCNRTYKLPWQLIKYTFNNRPDVIISNFLKLSLCACIARVFSPSTKLLLWEHAPPSMTSLFSLCIYSLSATIFYQLSTKIVAVSSGVGSDIASCTLGLKRKILAIYNPIIPPDFGLLNDALGKQKNLNKIICLGRLEPEKNPALLIEAFALIPEHFNATLLMIGDGSQRNQLESLSIKLGINNKVNFLGFVANPYLLLMNADLLVLPSNFEGFGNVIVEAMYCGLPVVSTDCPYGPREILMNEKYGSLVPTNDKKAMATAIEYELINRRSPEAQKIGAQRFLPNVIVNQFLDLVK